MQEKDGRVDLIDVVDGRVLHIEVGFAPRITVCHRHLAVTVAPIAIAPIGGVVGDAGMTDGTGEGAVGQGLQILRHETSIRSATAADLLLINIRVRATELAYRLGDITSRIDTCRIDMARSPLLSEACSATGLNDKHHIAKRCPTLPGITRLEVATRRAATAIIISDHRINAHGIGSLVVETDGQIVAAKHIVAIAVGEMPRPTFGNLHVAKCLGRKVLKTRGRASKISRLPVHSDL